MGEPTDDPQVPATGDAPPGVSASAAADGDTSKMQVEEAEDPVVQECDVYLNRMYDPPDFVGDLYLLQYPLRPLYRPYGDQGELDRVELKPKSRRLKFVYKLQRGDNYDEDSVVNERQGQKHVLTSAIVANPSCSYAMCVIHQGRMTVTPIRAVNQLRPDFEAFDKARAQQKVACETPLEAGVDPVAAALAAADAAGGASSDSGPEEAGGPAAGPAGAGALVEATEAMVAGAAVRVEYLPAGGSAGMGPWGAASAAGQEDPWTRLDHYRARSDEAMDIHQRHIVWPAAAAADAEAEGREPEHPKLQPMQLDGNRATFLARMCGQMAPGRERPRAEEPQDGLSLYVLSRMPAERQVEAVVRHFGVVSYSRQLRKRLPPSTLRSQGPNGLLAMLQTVAVLVAGNWVLKSSLAGFEGTEADARDMLLCLLAKKDGRLLDAEYQKWDEIFCRVVHGSARREMALSVAEHDQEKSAWKLKNPPDEDFKRKFPELVKEKMEWWESHRQGLLRKLQGVSKVKAPSGSAAAGSAARQRSRLLAEVRAMLTLGAKTLPELRRALQKNNPTVAIHENDLLQALQQKDCDAVQVRELWMLARTGHEENDAFRSALVTLFRQRDSVSKAEILAEYERLSGKTCTLSHFLVRQLIREIAEKADRDNYVLKGTLLQNVQGSSAT